MNNLKKKIVFIVLIVLIMLISASIGVFASYDYLASAVKYTNTKTVEQAEYQIENTGKKESQLQMLKKLSLTFDDFAELKKYCNKKGIMFLSTPFDLESIDFLASLGMPIFKIPSGEITNLPYLRKINSYKKEML